MRLDVHVERLRFQLRIWGIVDAGHTLSGGQVMKVAGKFTKLGSCAILLSLAFFHELFFVVRVEDGPNFFVFLLDMLEVLLTSIEVMLVFSAVEASETK